jgi:endonuclease-8
MRIVLETDEMHAVAFNVPVAEFETAAALARAPALRDLGPDLLDNKFVPAEAVGRIAERGEMDIADALLDQSALAGIGNIFKSEVLFAGRINPFLKVRDIDGDDIERLVTIAAKFLRANVAEGAPGGIATCSGLRRTGRTDPGARLWVYGRGGKPCRRCGTPISRTRQGPHARTSYWCERCQPR